MNRIFLIFLLLNVTFVLSSDRRFSPFRSAFRISGLSLARNSDDDLETLYTLLPSATRSKPLQTTPFNMATTKKRIISTLLEMTENEISKKLNQLDSAENNEVISSNNKRFKSELSTTLATERSDQATSSLFELSTEPSIKQSSTSTTSSTTAKPRKAIKITTSSSRDSIAAAEAAAAAIANMHSMAFPNKPNRVANTQTSKIPIHHHNPYNDYNHDKINFDVNYKPTEAPPAPPASANPTKKSKDKNRDSVKNILNGIVNFVSSPLFNQAKPLLISSFSTVSNALTNKNSGSTSYSPTSTSSNSNNAISSNVFSKMFNSLRYVVLRRNEATGTNGNKNLNSKKKGKLNSAINNSSSNNSNQNMLMSLLDTLLKARETLFPMTTPNNKPHKTINKYNSGASTNSLSTVNKNTNQSSLNVLSLLRLLWKQPALKQEARKI